MERVNITVPTQKKARWPSMAAAVTAVLFLGAGVAMADFVLTANINGNTVNYSAFGAEPNSDYNVVIQHERNGEANQYDEESDGDGEFSGSGTPGNATIEPGDSVTVSAYDDNDNKVASVTVKKEGETAPWWAYTGVGTLIWFIS